MTDLMFLERVCEKKPLNDTTMSNTPDFALQVEEAESQLNAQWQEVLSNWHDHVAGSYQTEVMEPYMKNFRQYLSGEGINGYGLTSLLQQMDNHLQEMASLTGYEENVAYY